MKSRKKIIVTGGSGYLGKYIINELIKKYHIISLDKKALKIKSKYYTMVRSTIKNFFKKRKINNIYAIIHLATAESRSNLYINNPKFAFQNIRDMNYIFDAIKKNTSKPILIFTSTKQIENDNKNGIKNPYSLSKEYCENLIRFYSEKHDIKSYILRISDIFSLSNNPSKKALYILISKLIKNKNVYIYNKEHFFEYISVQDIIFGIIKLLNQKNHQTKQINFYGKKIMILKLTKIIKKITKSKSKIYIKNKKNKKINFKIELYKIKKKWEFDINLKSIIEQKKNKI